MITVRKLLGVTLVLMLSACGGGGGGGGAASPSIPTLSATVSGLASGQSLLLQNNGGGNVSVTSNGGYSFAAPTVSSSYAVTVGTQPTGQICVVSQGIGTIASATSAVNVGVSCTTLTASSASLTTTAPTYTYPTTSVTALLGSMLISARSNSGAGQLSENSALDAAALAHANYLVNNQLETNVSYLTSVQKGGILGGHFEQGTSPGYTGSDPLQRASAQGYAGEVSETLTIGAATATGCFAALEDSVYHLVDLLSPNQDVGLGFNAGAGSASVCVIELGIPASTAQGQLPTAGNYVFYPGNNQTVVPPTFYNHAETPTPVSTLATAGHPIVVSLLNQTNPVLAGADVVVTGFTLTTGGVSQPLTVLVASGVTGGTVDSNLTNPGIVVAVPSSPLVPNTAYTVTVGAKVKGVPIVLQSWNFTTGAAN